MEWAARLPIGTIRTESRYAWVERFLSASSLDEASVMEPLAEQILLFASASGQTVVLNLDQTSVEDRLAIAMVSVRTGNRGLPLFWKVEATAGNIPTSAYTGLLDEVAGLLPEGTQVLLMADRFFDASALIAYCRRHGWGWRIRLKSHLNATHEGGEIRLSEMPKAKLAALNDARLSGGALTHIGYLHEAGHEEPWVIAMNATPTRTTILDYGLRWGIEAMFSDFKTRGFGLEDTHIQRPERFSRMLLVLAVAMHWAVVTGFHLQKKRRPREA
jgi:hypothetical protein